MTNEKKEWHDDFEYVNGLGFIHKDLLRNKWFAEMVEDHKKKEDEENE